MPITAKNNKNGYNLLYFFKKSIMREKILCKMLYFILAGHYLALINRAGGLYGRILTEVVNTDRKQLGLYTRRQLIRCLL